MKLFLAIPTYDGKVTAQCSESILRSCIHLRDNGIEVFPYYYSGNPYIAAARNVCVYHFLNSDCDLMMFLDSDVGFDKEAIYQLIRHDKEFIAGVYPYKQDEHAFPCIIAFDPETNNCKDEETGLVTAEVVPTGFLVLKRSVFEKMAKHYGMRKTHEKIYSFFDTGMLFAGDDTWYGEDVYFCRRWRDIGEPIWIEPRINFIHTGVKNWKGNLHEWLMSRSVEHLQNKIDYQATGVSGWTTLKELDALSHLAFQSGSVVEVGSWKGRSTKELLKSCNGTVYAVDHWKGSENDMTSIATSGKDIYQEFLKNVGHFPNLKVMRGSSLDMANAFNGIRVDMVFIDADHSYGAVKADIEAWLPKCDKYICGHDYQYPDVKRAVDEKFSKINLVDSLWWVELGA